MFKITLQLPSSQLTLLYFYRDHVYLGGKKNNISTWVKKISLAALYLTALRELN
jgi:hypothetical protein